MLRGKAPRLTRGVSHPELKTPAYPSAARTEFGWRETRSCATLVVRLTHSIAMLAAASYFMASDSPKEL